jgi:hypothetical protein
VRLSVEFTITGMFGSAAFAAGPPNTLDFDVVTIAPEVLTAPDRRKRVYVRLPKQGATEVSFCVDFDRSIDPVTGKQRFDMTPPADLAPPPH